MCCYSGAELAVWEPGRMKSRPAPLTTETQFPLSSVSVPEEFRWDTVVKVAFKSLVRASKEGRIHSEGGSVGVLGEGRRGEGRKGGKCRKCIAQYKQ